MSTPSIDTIHLAKGGHQSIEQGACLLEAVAYIAGEPHTDHPKCASPVLTSFGISLNDVLPDDLRQQLKPFIPALIGTAGDGHDEARGLMALDWLMREWLPTWLELAHLDEDAAALRALARIVDVDTAAKARPIVRASQKNAAAARDAVWAAAGAAAGAAARDAAWAAARDAAWAAAGDAVWAAARDAVWAAAGLAAGAAARDAARAAARDALRPTVAQLQQSAIDLYGRMVTVSQDGVDL